MKYNQNLLDMQHVNYEIKTFYLFIQTKENYQTNKTAVKIHLKSIFYLLGGKTANHVNFMLPMLISC